MADYASLIRPTSNVVNDQTKQGSYGQFCPVAMAAEIICSRWTALILREMLCGTTRFNDLRRGVPLMSPTLIADLRELAGSEHQQDDDEQDDQLAKTQTHGDCVARFRIGCP